MNQNRYHLIFLIFLILFSCSKETIQYQLSIKVNPENSGSVNPSSGFYDENKEISITATPNNNYLFKGWDGISSINNPATLVMNSDKLVTANFELKPYELSININGKGKVDEELINKTTNSIYPSGSSVKLTATGEEGWIFSHWSGDLNSEENPFEIDISKKLNLTANFIQLYSITELDINHPKLFEIWQGMSLSSNSNIYFQNDGIKHIVSIPALGRVKNEVLLPVIHLVNKGEVWETANLFEDIYMSFGGRDVHPYGRNGFVWADHGTEVWLAGGTGTPYNNVWIAENFSSTGAEWTKVNKDRSFYHGVSSGDLNYDGLIDVVAIHMSTSSKKPEDDFPYHVFLKQNDGSFKIDYGTLKYPGSPLPAYYFYNTNDTLSRPGVIRASILIEDVTGDGKPEIIGGAATHNENWNVPEKFQNSLEVWTDKNYDGVYEELKFHKRMGWWEYNNMAASQIKASDIDKDGDKDLIVNFEGSLGSQAVSSANFNGIQIFRNKGKGEFEYFSNDIPFEDLRISEFELLDVDNDGDDDIVFNLNCYIDLGSEGGKENSFYYRNKNRFIKNLEIFDQNFYSAELDFDELIYYNEGGVFMKKEKGYKIRLNKAVARERGFDDFDYIVTGLMTMNATLINNKLVFYGYFNDLDREFLNSNNINKYQIKLFEYSPDF